MVGSGLLVSWYSWQQSGVVDSAVGEACVLFRYLGLVVCFCLVCFCSVQNTWWYSVRVQEAAAEGTEVFCSEDTVSG